MNHPLTFFAAILLSLNLSLRAESYTNPIIPGYYPDPSICRVGDDFYLVNSSFEYFPGVPLFHSKDLVNWEQLGHCLDRESQLKLDGLSASLGIYAPTIRYNDGTFYMITTNVCAGGNFVVRTDDLSKGWSEPVWIAQNGIDPSLFWEDGKCYLTTSDGGISMSEIDLATGKLLTQPRIIWHGTGGRYPEGPHIYKKDGWYYLMISEGGTEFGHKVTVARSRNIWGPYDSNPSNPILTHFCEKGQLSPIQGTGHADMVQAKDGSWWVVFLAFRPVSQGLHHFMGRETFLAPVEWKEGEWPVINQGKPVSLDMNDVTLLPSHPVAKVESRCEFNDPKLPLYWTYLRNPDSDNYKIKDGRLILQADTKELDSTSSPTFVARRQQHPDFTAETVIQLTDAQSGDRAGMNIFYRAGYHYDINLTKISDNEYALSLDYSLSQLRHTEKRVSLAAIKDASPEVYLQIKGNNDYYTFSYSLDGKNYESLGVMDTRFLSSETAGGFTGNFIGLFAVKKSQTSKARAEFEYFDYKY